MKNLILVFAMVPMLAIGQVSNWRTNPPQQQQSTPQRSTPSVQPSTPQRNDVSSWRNNPPQNNNREVTVPRLSYNNRRGQYYVPFYDGRWNRWGAPMYGYNYWTPGIYYNDWGYRKPARIYVYDNGKRDTVKGKPTNFSFGVQSVSFKNQIGGWATIGDRIYFITEYNSTINKDNSTYFPYGKITQVDFPMVDDLVSVNSFYIGLGKKINKTGFHIMVGTINENVKYRGKDDIGFITFPKYNNQYASIKVGVIRDFKNTTLKIDLDPTTKSATLGFGLNF
jgi:hypothetical protein